jgi:hypothetical protein
MAFAPALRRFTFTTHVTSSVGWIGAVLVFLALAAIGLMRKPSETRTSSYRPFGMTPYGARQQLRASAAAGGGGSTLRQIPAENRGSGKFCCGSWG